MATRCLDRPRESRPGPSAGTPDAQTHGGTGGPTSSSSHPAGPAPLNPQPGAPLSSHAQAPHPHLHPQSRPFFYVQHAPQPPPFLQYPWPMPLPYNPLAGFPAMGYGMVMPPFPHSPYMEAPGGYILPPLQPHDYRRFLPPQFPVAPMPFQCPVPTHRFRPQQHVSVAREMVNSEVQTEPTRTRPSHADGGSPATGSESGHGTTSVSPSLSGSSTGRRAGVEIDTLPGCSNTPECPPSPAKLSPFKYGVESSPAKCLQTASEANKSMKDNDAQKNASRSRGSLGHVFETWSVCSTDCIVPVCSSSDREDDAVPAKERRVSFPDILMNWSVGTPPVVTLNVGDKLLLQEGHLPSSKETAPEHEKTLNRSPAEKGSSRLADEDAEVHSPRVSETRAHKILKLPFILNKSHASRLVNDSVWSVDSLMPYVPSRDWLVRNGLADTLTTVLNDEFEQGNDSAAHDDSVDVSRLSLSLARMKKMNESVWSVESLPPYTPSNEWLVQNGFAEPDVIVEEVMDDSPDGVLSTQTTEQTGQMHRRRRLSRRFSLSSVESLPVHVPSTSWLSEQRNVNGVNRFPQTSKWNTHASSAIPVDTESPRQKPALACENPPLAQEGRPECGSTMVVSETNCLPCEPLEESSATARRNKVRDVENGSSEPEANLGPNQECVNVEWQADSPCPPEKVDVPLPQPVTRDQNFSVQSTLRVVEHELGKCEREEAGQQLTDEILKVDVDELINEELGQETADQKLINEELGQETADQKLINEELGQETADQKLINEELGQETADQKLINEELGQETADHETTTMSPIKAHMVDFGVQCSDLLECPCHCTSKVERRKCLSQIMDSGRGSKCEAPEDTCENGQKLSKRNGQGKNRQQDARQHNKPFTQRHWQRDIQEEPNSGHNGRTGKAKGGSGRNTRY